MKYPILLMSVALLLSFVVSETLRSDINFLYFSEDNQNEQIRERRSPNPPAAAQPPVEHINYRPYSQVPANIKQLLQFQQAREPITHIKSQLPPQLAKAPSQDRTQYNPQVRYAAQSQAQSHTQANYQAPQSSLFRQNTQQAQPPYNPQQQFHGNQQQAPGIVFHPDQRRLY